MGAGLGWFQKGVAREEGIERREERGESVWVSWYHISEKS